MSVQTIINSAQQIEFDRRRIIGQTVSRSERIRTAERASAQAFKFTVTPPARFNYTTYRPIIESIQLVDRLEEQQVYLSTNSNLNYITQYQGACSSAQLTSMTIQQFTNTQVTFSGLPSIGTATIVFKAGDWIQPSQSRYPYIVSETVYRGSGTLVTATVHRSLITSENTTTTGTFFVGTATSLRLVITELPTYKIINRNQGEFSGNFTLVEKII